MAQFRYIEYKEDVNSLNVTALQQINKSGVYKGFDISVATLGINFVHTATGRSVLLPNGTKQANSGIVLSKEGVIIIDDTTYSKTILANNDVSLGRWDIIVLTHQHVEVQGGAIATIDVIQGTLGAGKPDSSLTDYQIPLCYVYLPPSTTDLTTDVGVLVQPVRIEKDIIVAAKDSSPYYLSRADYICDGVADEVKIQAAIDYVTSSLVGSHIVSGKVLLAGGSYYIENAITLKDGLHLESVGEAVIYPDSNALSINIFEGTASNVKLENIKAGVYTSGGSAVAFSSFALSNSVVTNVKSDLNLILSAACTNLLVSNNSVKSIISTFQLTDVVVRDNNLGRGIITDSYAISLTNVSNTGIRIISNYVRDDITLVGTESVISSNVIKGFDADNGIIVTNLNYSTIVGNSFASNITAKIIPATATNNNVYGIEDGSETVKGKVELATNAETLTGTATDKVLTPANLRSVFPVSETWKEVGNDSGATTLNAGWDISSLSAYHLDYRKDNLGNVYISGRFRCTTTITAGNSLLIFTLPVAYRVGVNIQGIAVNTDNGIMAVCQYDNDPLGEIKMFAISGNIVSGDAMYVNMIIFKD